MLHEEAKCFWQETRQEFFRQKHFWDVAKPKVKRIVVQQNSERIHLSVRASYEEV